MRQADDQLARQLEFLVPGIVHTLGNDLFAIRGNAQVMASGRSEPSRGRSAILEATERAEHTLEILRLLTEDDPFDARQRQAGILLHRLCQACKLPLRERAIRVVLEHSSKETPSMVDGAVLVRAVVEVVRRIAVELPSAIESELHVDLSHQDRLELSISMRLEVKPTFLPFPVDIAAVCTGVADYLASLGASIRGPGPKQTLTLCVPALRAR